MTKVLPSVLICTVGTSLIYPNLAQLPNDETSYQSWIKKQPESEQNYLNFEFVSQLKKAFLDNDVESIGKLLMDIPDTARLCGAEINSIFDLIHRGYCQDKCQLFFCYSATPDGEKVSKILDIYYKNKGYQSATEKIAELQDENPKLFRTKGLRNLAKKVCEIIRQKTALSCAINATGGYKAQIAIAVLMGQALRVPVYYKHERFSEIISFPPMPISLDFSLWLEKSGVLTALERASNKNDLIKYQELEEDWNEQMETLIERVEMDGQIYLELSPTGQIFHETFKGRFESERDQVLPPSVALEQKKEPNLTSHNWRNARNSILSFLQKIIDECSYVYSCRTHYWNPDLSSTTLFHIKGENIEGIFSNGSWTVKFIVETSANTHGQRAACIADLNYKIEQWKI